MKYFERNHDYLFELAEDETRLTPITEYAVTRFVELDPDMGQIWIGKGYAWDGSSIPFKKFLRKITFGKYDPDKYCKEASLVHDAFYQLMRLNLLSRDHKDTIDRLYEKMCISGGMSKRQAARRYWFVKKFGARTLKPRYYPEKVILDTGKPLKGM